MSSTEIAIAVSLCLAASACARPRVRAPGACSDAPAGPTLDQPVVLPLETYFRQLRTIDIVVNGKAMPLLLDTGAGLTALSADTAAAVGCKPFGRVTGYRFDGERVDFARCAPTELGIGPVRITEEVQVFDFGKVIPPELPEVNGVLSFKTLEHVPFTLELAQNRLILESQASLDRRVAGLSPLQVRLSREGGGAGLAVFVAARAEPSPVWLELDTGNIDRAMLSPETAAAIGLGGPTSAAAGDPGDTPVSIPLLGISPVKARVRVVSEPLVYDGNIGAEVVERLTMTFDLAHGRVWAGPAELGQPPQ